MEHSEAALGRVLPVADDIGVGHGPGRDQLLFAQILDSQQPVPQQRRPLEFQGLGSLLHLAAQVLGHGLVLAPQQQNHLVHDGPVGLGRFPGLAPAVAVVHMVVEAGPVLADVPGKDLAAPRQMEREPEGVDQLIGDRPAAVGSEVIRPVAGDLADQLHHRIVCPPVDAQIRVALVIL